MAESTNKPDETPKSPKRKRAVRYALAAEIKEVEREFYTRYASHALLNKVIALAHALENAEGFSTWVSSHPELSGFPIDNSYFESIRAEIYLTEFHQFEAFFTLLIAPFQRVPAWIYLTAYKTNEFIAAVEAYARGDIPALTNGAFQDKAGFLRYALYMNCEPLDQDLLSRWAENIDNAVWLIDRFVTHYLEGRDEYNGYKHGLRLLVGQSTFSIGLEAFPGGPVTGTVDQFSFPDSVVVLQFQDVEPGIKSVHRTLKHFNPWVSVLFISKMAQMAETIRTTRLAAIGGTPVGDLATHFQLNREEILQEETSRRFQAIFTL